MGSDTAELARLRDEIRVLHSLMEAERGSAGDGVLEALAARLRERREQLEKLERAEDTTGRV